MDTSEVSKIQNLSASLTVDSNNNNGFQPARLVMNTATSPEDSSQDISLLWEPDDPTWRYYVYMHFAEVVELPSNETREFLVLLNEKSMNMSAFSPRYLYTDTLYVAKLVSGPRLEFTLRRTDKSTLPPIVNAVETYQLNEFFSVTYCQTRWYGIMIIKSKYGVKKNWLGDPCGPDNYPWMDISCSYADKEPPRIVSVNLSFSGLTGPIDPAFSNLTSLEKLDLSNNSLTGKVPDFLANLYLTELNLEGNKLVGALPAKLLERSNDNSLVLRVGGNPDLCVSASCQDSKEKTKKKVYIIPLVGSIAGVFSLVIVTALLLMYKRGHRSGRSNGVRTGPLDTKRYYTYSEVVKVTSNFERELGQGGFGKVYHGILNEEQVAVKILSESSAQGYREFRAEVELLLRVHHKNLTALTGYCNAGKKMALIYEQKKPNSPFGYFLNQGKKSYVLSWEERLQISLDAAQGLEYLHNDCKPPIVQRDVKPTNILINEKLQAKIADFWLSKSVLDGTNHDTTTVAGTIGYLVPEYQSMQQLSEKSDVYSFGVVLLEVVTGQPVILRSRTTAENIHITDRVELLLSTGDINGIVDPKLGERFDAGSAWKITEVAMACASRSSKNRPTMSQVVAELKESVSRARDGGGSGASGVAEPAMTHVDSGMFPQAR
ncbi:unnamed protein product [Brassica oleracea]